jgi:hypothetical protein
MNVRKVCTLILAVFTLIIVLSAYSTSHRPIGRQLASASLRFQIRDGGGPAPPYPPKPSFGTLIADGGGPAPPYPPKPSFGTLIADGGGPAPPYPPSLAAYIV